MSSTEIFQLTRGCTISETVVKSHAISHMSYVQLLYVVYQLEIEMSNKTEQDLTDELRLAAESAAPYSTAMIGASHLNEVADTIDNLRIQLAEAQKERDKAIDLLETMFSSYENGTACYEEPEDCSGFVGYAFKMEDLDFNACWNLLISHTTTRRHRRGEGEPT